MASYDPDAPKEPAARDPPRSTSSGGRFNPEDEARDKARRRSVRIAEKLAVKNKKLEEKNAEAARVAADRAAAAAKKAAAPPPPPPPPKPKPKPAALYTEHVDPGSNKTYFVTTA